MRLHSQEAINIKSDLWSVRLEYESFMYVSEPS